MTQNLESDEDFECRVCRSGPDTNRPLHSPCHCSGSIALVHQDCLETWLTHSRKDHCELCGVKYQFFPQYAENTPSVLPFKVLLFTTLKKVFKDYIPTIFHMCAVFVVWLILVPVLTCQLYRMWIRIDSFEFYSLKDRIVQDSISGIVLSAFILLTFIVMMSFLDFLRFHGIPDDPIDNVQNLQNNNVLPVPDIGENRNNVADNVNNEVNNMNINQNNEVQNNNVLPVNANNNNAFPDIPNVPGINQDILNQQLPNEQLNDVDEGDGEGIFDDNDFDDEDEDFPAERGRERGGRRRRNRDVPGDGDVRFALDEILGLRGLTHLFRNAWLLLAFNCLYIGIFGCAPYIFGKHVVKILKKYLTSQVGSFSGSEYFFNILLKSSLNVELTEYLKEIKAITEAKNNAVHFYDVVYIFTGYFTLLFLTFIVYEILKLFKERLLSMRSVLTNVIISVIQIVDMVKVGLLLFIRVFALPLCLGVLIVICFNVFLGYDTVWWASFSSNNVVGIATLAWVGGISFMVSITLTILQIREILHPCFLAQIIRPQEPHIELLKSLKNESGWVHTKRIISSVSVYMIFIFLFIYLPLIISKKAIFSYFSYFKSVSFFSFESFYSHPDMLNTPVVKESDITVYFCYIIPQIQIPLELAVAHLTFLTFLDKKKSSIGRYIHKWLVFMCDILGLTRFLLPHLMQKATPSSSAAHARAIAMDLLNNQNNTNNNSNTNNRDRNRVNPELFLVDENGDPVVLSPLKRPPPGWDSRTVNTSRWAWFRENKNLLELHVAPIKYPSLWPLRCAVLIFTSWAFFSMLFLTILFAPILFGRTILSFTKIPLWMWHDPACYIMGISCFYMLHKYVIKKANAVAISWLAQELQNMPFSYLIHFVRLITCWFLVGIVVGASIQMILAPTSSFYSFLTISNLISTYLKGVIITTLCVWIIYYGYFDRVIQFLLLITTKREENSPAGTYFQSIITWSQGIKNTINEPGLAQGSWTNEKARLQQIWQLLVWPAFKSICLEMITFYFILTTFLPFFVEFLSPTSFPIPMLSQINDQSKQVQIATKWIGLVVAVLMWLLPAVRALVWVSCVRIYETVLDENYLIGRKLMDFVSKPQTNQDQSTQGTDGQVRRQ